MVWWWVNDSEELFLTSFVIVMDFQYKIKDDLRSYGNTVKDIMTSSTSGVN